MSPGLGRWEKHPPRDTVLSGMETEDPLNKPLGRLSGRKVCGLHMDMTSWRNADIEVYQWIGDTRILISS